MSGTLCADSIASHYCIRDRKERIEGYRKDAGRRILLNVNAYISKNSNAHGICNYAFRRAAAVAATVRGGRGLLFSFSNSRRSVRAR